jgi:putative spermidine/putrescine transport system permease protein
MRQMTLSKGVSPANIKWPIAEHWRAYGLLLPAVSLVALLLGGGLVLALLQSVGLFGILSDSTISVAAYRQALTSAAFWRSLWLSFCIAVVTTGLSTLCSIGLALLLRSAGRWASFAYQLTLPIPHLVGIAGMLLLISPSGLISRLLYALGLISSDQAFPLLVNDSANLGVIILFLWKEIPFITLILLAVLRGIRPEYEIQARALGASPWQGFWHITLPLMKPGIISASLIVFGFIFSSFEVPFLLGSTYPPTLPVLVYRAFTDTDLTQRTTAIALGLLLSLISVLLSALYLKLGSDRAPSHTSRGSK